jgi:hypothetical protein
MGFGLVNWIYWTLIDCNYSAVASSHTLQLTTGCTKLSQSAVSSPVVAWWWIPTISLCFHAHVLAGDCHTTNSLLQLSSMDHTEKTLLLSCCIHCYVCVCWDAHVITTQPLPSNGRCLQSHCLAMAVVYLFIWWLLPSSGSAWHNIKVYCITLNIRRPWI